MNLTDDAMDMIPCNDTLPQPIHSDVFIAATIQGVIAGVGILGNALVIFVLMLARDRQDTSSVIYVLNLAAADLFFLVTVPFMIAQDITLQWNSGDFMCKFAAGFLMYLNFFVSPLFLMVMSIDRYLAVNKAVSSAKLRALKSSKFASLAVWSIAVIAVLPTSFFYSVHHKCKPMFPGSAPSLLPPDIPLCELNERYERCTHDYISKHKNRTLSNEGEYVRERRDIGLDITPWDSRPDKARYLNGEIPAVGLLGHMSPNVISGRVTDGRGVGGITMQTSTAGISLNQAPILSPTHGPVDESLHKAGQSLKDEAEAACIELLTGLSGEEEVAKCGFGDEPYSFHVWVVINFFYSYLIPSAVIVVCYMAILRKLYRPSRIAQSHSRGRVRRQAMRKKVTLMVAMLVVSYIICFTPYYLWQLMNVPGITVSSATTCGDIRRFNTTMAYLNSALNPILYTFLGDQFAPKFRVAFRRVARSTAEYRLGTRLTRRKKTSTERRRAMNRGDVLIVAESPRPDVASNNNTEQNNVPKSPELIESFPNEKRNGSRRSTNGSSSQNVTPPNKSKRKFSSGIFDCMKNCSTNDECPQCAIEKTRTIPPSSHGDIIEENEDDIVTNEGKPMVTSQKSITSGNGVNTELNCDVTSSTEHDVTDGSQKLCKRHKRSLKYSDRVKMGRIPIGEWRPSSSTRSETKFMTELTVCSTNI